MILFYMLGIALHPVSADSALIPSSERCFNQIRAAESCDEKLKLFRENLESCRTTTSREVNSDPIDYADHLLEIGECFRKAQKRAEAESAFREGILMRGKDLKRTESFREGLEILVLPPGKECLDAQKFKERVIGFARTHDLAPLIANLSREELFDYGAFESKDTFVKPFSEVANEIQSHAKNAKLNIEGHVLDEEHDHGSLLVFVRGWHKQPYSRGVFEAQKEKSCYRWRSFFYDPKGKPFPGLIR